jgi:hypothetical protein
MYNDSLRVHLIDTPGFDDTNKKDVEVLRDIAGWLGVTYKKSILLSGLIYLHPISDNRLRGSALRNLYMFKKLCGPDCLPGIVMATTMWGLVDPEDGLKRENQLRGNNDFWGEMEKGGSLVMRHQRTRESALAILEVIIRRKHQMVLKMQDEMVNQRKGLEDTGAGIKVNEDLIAADRKHKQELANLREEMKEADAASRKEIKELMLKQQAEIDENRRQREDLEANMKDLERERAKDLENLKQQLLQQANSLEAKEKELDAFRDSLAERERTHNLHSEEQRKLRAQLDTMERDAATQMEAFQTSLNAVQRKATGKCPFLDCFFANVYD